MTDLMIVEILKDDEWIERMFQDIIIGSKFRMRNPNTKELFVGDSGKTEFVAISKPYVKNIDVDHSVLTIDIRTTWKHGGFYVAGKKICSKEN